MSTIATTRLSSKGQVVIPEEIRKRLGLESGMQFVVIAENDVVILRAIEPPSMDEFDELISQARSAARRTCMRQSDIEAATTEVRRRATTRSGQ